MAVDTVDRPRPLKPHPNRDDPLHERFTLRLSRSSPYAASNRLGRHCWAMVAVTDDVMQLAMEKLEELQSIPVSVTLEPFITQHRVLECYGER